MGGTIQKNGKDQAQDHAIRDLHSELMEFREEENRAHAKLGEAVMSVDARVEKYIFGGRIAWAFIGLIGIGVMAYQRALDLRLTVVEQRVDEVSERQAAWEPFATKWGNDLGAAIDRNDKHSQERHLEQQKEIDEMKSDIRDIRRRLFGGR